jgi:hypothetical protein
MSVRQMPNLLLVDMDIHMVQEAIAISLRLAKKLAIN